MEPFEKPHGEVAFFFVNIELCLPVDEPRVGHVWQLIEEDITPCLDVIIV